MKCNPCEIRIELIFWISLAAQQKNTGSVGKCCGKGYSYAEKMNSVIKKMW